MHSEVCVCVQSRALWIIGLIKRTHMSSVFIYTSSASASLTKYGQRRLRILNHNYVCKYTKDKPHTHTHIRKTAQRHRSSSWRRGQSVFGCARGDGSYKYCILYIYICSFLFALLVIVWEAVRALVLFVLLLLFLHTRHNPNTNTHTRAHTLCARDPRDRQSMQTTVRDATRRRHILTQHLN